MTKQRKIIYDIIMSANHLTAEEIFLRAKKVLPSMAFGTVYRNLAIMAQEREIGKVEFIGEPTKYDKSSVPHCHIQCVKCGAVKDIVVEGVNQLIESHVTNFVNYQLNINYVCDACKR